MRTFTVILLLVIPLLSAAQKAQQESRPPYPQDYFRNPLDIPILLAGNFGECRPGHFHSGVDIKTKGNENQPVHAAAEGYISRIKMDKGGFGHALYITHPNGYTTLYAHLNNFAPAIQQYLKKEQYEKKHWDVDIQLPPAQFAVKKGQQIAWSGNTGSSTAPHLHFEIRNTKTEHPLNPQLFGLPIVDKTGPVPAEIVFYKWGVYESSGINIPLSKKGGVFVPSKVNSAHFNAEADTVVLPAGPFGVGINVDDFMDGSENTIAFYTAQLFLDDSLQAQVTLDDIGYDETRYINAYADYKTRQQQHKWVQCLFKLPGNHLDNIYSYLNDNKGRISIEGGRPHKVSVVITDDKGNTGKVVLYVLSTNENILPEIPDIKTFVRFSVNKPNSFNDSNVSFSLDNRQLYDDVMFRYKVTFNPTGYSDKYMLHYPYVPVHHYFDLKIRPTQAIPAGLRDKVVMLYSDNEHEDGRAAAQTDNNWYKAKVRSFGTYRLDIDTMAPAIKALQKNNSDLSKARQIAFEVRDNMTAVKMFNGYLDDKWICFEQHGDLFFYKFDEHCPRGRHQLVFTAEDENGNTQTVRLNFTR